jgi:hypothetical protein
MRQHGLGNGIGRAQPGHSRANVFPPKAIGVRGTFHAQVATLVSEEAFEARRRQLGIAHRVLDRLVAEIALDRAGIDALIGQLIAASVPEHVRVYLHVETRSLARTVHHRLEASGREWRAALADKDERRVCRLALKAAQDAQFTARQGVRRRTTLFYSADVQDAAF